MPSPEVEQGRYLRRNMTGIERRVWSRIRDKRVDGHRFRRQVPIGPYFADFVCLSARLVVELDGEGHEEKSDDRKTAYLEGQGFRVMRFPAQDVDESIDDVIHAIYLELHAPTRR